jgi:hypothetical protein
MRILRVTGMTCPTHLSKNGLLQTVAGADTVSLFFIVLLS